MKTVAAMTQERQGVAQPCLAWAGLARSGMTLALPCLVVYDPGLVLMVGHDLGFALHGLAWPGPCLVGHDLGFALHGLAWHERSAIEGAGQVSMPDPWPWPCQCTGGCQASGTNGPAGILSQTGLYVRFGSS